MHTRINQLSRISSISDQLFELRRKFETKFMITLIPPPPIALGQLKLSLFLYCPGGHKVFGEEESFGSGQNVSNFLNHETGFTSFLLVMNTAKREKNKCYVLKLGGGMDVVKTYSRIRVNYTLATTLPSFPVNYPLSCNDPLLVFCVSSSAYLNTQLRFSEQS